MTDDPYDTVDCPHCGHVAGLHSGSLGCLGADHDGHGGVDECGCDEFASRIVDGRAAEFYGHVL